MAEPEDAHFTATFPSDTIAEVMEAHFNKAVFRQKVRVVDLRMQSDMCMFSLAWVTSDTPVTPPTHPEAALFSSLTPQAQVNGSRKRDPQGRFIPVMPREE